MPVLKAIWPVLALAGAGAGAGAGVATDAAVSPRPRQRGARLLRSGGQCGINRIVFGPDGGMYIGQTTVMQEGTYQLALPIPGGTEEPLSKYLQ